MELERPPELLHHLLASCLVAVQLEAVVGEARCPQAFVHDLERCGLFAHEENRAPLGEELGDDVGDRLALARSRGAHP